MTKYALMLAVAAAALTAAPAQAQEDWRSGLYIKGGLGWNHAEDQDVGATSQADFKEGYVASGAVGADFGGARVEAEIAYRRDKVDELSTAGTALPTPEGTLLSTAFMVNGYLDMPTATPFTPYIGAGVGVANVKINDYATAGTPVADKDDNVFAYQAILGTSYALSPEFDLFGEYRYFATQDVDSGVAGASDTPYRNHALMVGAVYNFQ